MKKFLVTLLLFLCSYGTFAIPNPPQPLDAPPPPEEPLPVYVWLYVLAIGFGIYKIYTNKKASI